MGYNNNHAGMHMIRFKRYGIYDDLEYYDRLATEKSKTNHKNDEPLPKRPVIETKSSVTSKIKNNKPVKETKLTSPVLQKTVDASLVKNMKEKRPQEKPTSAKSKSKYGTEILISPSHLFYSDIVSTNVMLMALQNKWDVRTILKDLEDIMKRDKRTNPEPVIFSPMYGMPKVQMVCIYLSLLSEKIGCPITALFTDDESFRKTFVYDLISKIDYCIWDGEIDESTGDAYFTIENYDYVFMGIKPSDYLYHMDLRIDKERIDNKYYYSISYGDIFLRGDFSANSYLKFGATLFDETEGKLQEYIDAVIDFQSEWESYT